MLPIKEIMRKNSLAVVLAVVTALSACGAVFVVSIKSQELATSKEALAKANEQIAKLTEDLGSLTTDAEQAKKDAVNAKDKTDSLTADLEAFAKQAAACEALKKQIKPKK